MAVGYSASAASHASGSFSINQASFTFNVTIGSSDKGVLVLIAQGLSATDVITGVTVGGVAMTAVPGSFATDTVAEPGSVKAYFLGSGLPAAGSQAVVVNRVNNGTTAWAVAIAISAAADTEIGPNIVLLQEDGTYTEQAVDDGSTGVSSLRFAIGYTGITTPPPVGGSSTLLFSNDFGNYGATACREAAAGQGSRNVGFSSGTTDDRAAVHLDVRELAVTHPTASGGPKLKKMKVAVTALGETVSSGAPKLKKMKLAGAGGPFVLTYTAPVAKWSGSSTSGYSGPLTVAPTAIGDVMVAGVLNQGGTQVASLSGGGVTTWTRIGSPWTDSETKPSILEYWIGVITATGSTTMSITWAAAPGANFCELTVQQFHANTSGTWNGESVDNKTNASAGTVTYPALTANHAPEIYVGHASTPNAISVSAPSSGFTASLTSGNDTWMVGLAYSGTVLPAHSVSISTPSYALGVLIYLDTTPSHPSASGGVSLKKMTLFGISTEQDIGIGAVRLKKMMLAGASAEKAIASGGPKLKKMKLSGTLIKRSAASVAIRLKKMGLAGTGAGKTIGSAASRMKKMKIAGTLIGKSVASAAPRLKKMSLAGAGAGKTVVSGGPKLKKMSLAGAGAGKTVVSGGPKLKKMKLAGTLIKKAVGPGAIRLKKMSLAASGAGKSAASGGPKLKKMRLSGTAIKKSVGAGAVILKKTKLAGAGTGKASGPGAIRLKKMKLQGDQTPISRLQGSIVLKKMKVAIAGAGKAIVSGGPRLKKMRLAGTSTEKTSASGGVRLKKMVPAGSQADVCLISGGPRLKKMRVASTSAEKTTGSANVHLKKMRLAGTGSGLAVATGGVKQIKMAVAGIVQIQGAAPISASGAVHLNKMQVHGSDTGEAELVSASQLFVFSSL